jgi:hypothetical protein
MRLSLRNTNVNIDSLLFKYKANLHTKLLCRSLYYVIYVELYTKALHNK